MLRSVVVDDETPARDELKYLLSLEAGIELAGEADSGPAAIELIPRIKPDIVFMDVQMRGMTGMEAALIIRKIAPQTLIVFATAYDEYAVKAFEVGATDYLLKPFEAQRLHATVERLRSYRPGEWREAAGRVDEALKRTRFFVRKLPVEKNGKIVLLDYQDVIYVYTQAGVVNVVTSGGEYVYNGTLMELEERLRDTGLIRVHKSYVVNMNKVKEVIPWFKGTYWLKMEGLPDTEIPVSKGQIKELKDIFGLK
ncbi:Hypothetical protein LUCI_1163 [Lucifera butyrica]|uniref:Uncharacterized protein n=1 Tax=Lucifera butyrica TaxID=1351585 RepID=A0A498R6Q7_9FIRM|nr:LytTR family DNA-binding domain-containing protein [Lucifera butyrica]VBB05952.1 Hypothetical protein LUCI_1163 [Lucifera butyrica]